MPQWKPNRWLSKMPTTLDSSPADTGKHLIHVIIIPYDSNAKVASLKEKYRKLLSLLFNCWEGEKSQEIHVLQ